MNENAPGETQTLSVPAGPPPGYVPAGATGPQFVPPAAQRPEKTRWRDVIFGWRAAVAVFVAGIIVGGVVGSAITLIADHHGSTNGPTISRFPGGGAGFPGRGFGQNGGSGFGQDGGQTGQTTPGQVTPGQTGQTDGFLGQSS